MFLHKAVLLKEAIDGLAIKSKGIYVDATFGRGGHSKAILEQMGPTSRLIAMDLDPEAIAVTKSAPFDSDARFEITHSSFRELAKVISNRGWLGLVDGVLLDLGVSSPQLDDPARGFSFMKEGPLDMRMNTAHGIDAATWINQAEAEDIANVLYEYGEERLSRRIAANIVRARETTRIETTTQLANIIASCVPKLKPKNKQEKFRHPATRSFQAIRIFINQELEALTTCLSEILSVLSVGGRLCVISFHSLEDRIVKQFMQKEAKGDDYPPGLPIRADQLKPRLKLIGKSIEPSESEVLENPRSRSARLRIAEKL